MNESRWCSKRAVQHDLAVFGLDVSELDDEHIVIGDRPPPIQREVLEDDEFLLRYGGSGSIPDKYDTMKPDLEGIKKLLQMVKETESDSEDNSSIVISKLNPNVKEFVPESVKNEEKNKPLKLLTPDYFLTKQRKESSNKTSNVDESVKDLSGDTSQIVSNPSPVDPAIQESINKVNTWFYGEPKRSSPKPPVLSLDQSGFRRKNKSNENPSSPVPTVGKTSGGDTGNQYKPSEYANDLFKTYSERAEQRQTRKQDMWSALEAQLKARDEKIKKKMREQNNASLNSN